MEIKSKQGDLYLDKTDFKSTIVKKKEKDGHYMIKRLFNKM